MRIKTISCFFSRLINEIGKQLNLSLSLIVFMKKLAIIVLLPFYLFVAVGVGINVHYCMGEIEYVVVMGSHGDCCCDEFEDMTGCCEDEVYYQVLEDSQQVSSKITTPHKLQLGEISHFTIIEELVENRDSSKGNFYADLPPPDGPPIWLSNCSLTYYG